MFLNAAARLSMVHMISLCAVVLVWKWNFMSSLILLISLVLLMLLIDLISLSFWHRVNYTLFLGSVILQQQSTTCMVVSCRFKVLCGVVCFVNNICGWIVWYFKRVYWRAHHNESSIINETNLFFFFYPSHYSVHCGGLQTENKQFPFSMYCISSINYTFRIWKIVAPGMKYGELVPA